MHAVMHTRAPLLFHNVGTLKWIPWCTMQFLLLHVRLKNPAVVIWTGARKRDLNFQVGFKTKPQETLYLLRLARKLSCLLGAVVSVERTRFELQWGVLLQVLNVVGRLAYINTQTVGVTWAARTSTIAWRLFCNVGGFRVCILFLNQLQSMHIYFSNNGTKFVYIPTLIRVYTSTKIVVTLKLS